MLQLEGNLVLKSEYSTLEFSMALDTNEFCAYRHRVRVNHGVGAAEDIVKGGMRMTEEVVGGGVRMTGNVLSGIKNGFKGNKNHGASEASATQAPK